MLSITAEVSVRQLHTKFTLKAFPLCSTPRVPACPFLAKFFLYAQNLFEELKREVQLLVIFRTQSCGDGGGAGNMATAHWVRAHTAPSEGLSLVLSIHVRWPTLSEIPDPGYLMPLPSTGTCLTGP